MELHTAGSDYLEAVLLLGQERSLIRAADVARYLGVTRASVCKAAAQLRSGGYLDGESKYLELTERGRSVAEQNHDRYTFFLTMLLRAGVPPEAAQQDACQLRHAISEESYRRLRALFSSLSIPDSA